MRKNQIKVGEVYTAKVSGKYVPVRIISHSVHGGWIATNTKTGRAIHIKTAGRLSPYRPESFISPEFNDNA
jgi:hypothetical protein